MLLDLSHGTINVPLVQVLTEPDENRVVRIGNALTEFWVISDTPMPKVGTWISALLIPLGEPNPQPESFRVKYWDYFE